MRPNRKPFAHLRIVRDGMTQLYAATYSSDPYDDLRLVEKARELSNAFPSALQGWP